MPLSQRKSQETISKIKIQNTQEFLNGNLFLLEEQFLHIWQPWTPPHTHTHSLIAYTEFRGHPVCIMPPSVMDTRWYPATADEEHGMACLGIQKLVENPLPPTSCSLQNLSFGMQSDLNKQQDDGKSTTSEGN